MKYIAYGVGPIELYNYNLSEKAIFLYSFIIKMGFDWVDTENMHFIWIILGQWLKMMLLVIMNILPGLDDTLKI